MFSEGDEVEVVACQRDPRLVGKRGFVIDQAPPFNGVWTVNRMPGFLTPNSYGFDAHEIKKTGNNRLR